MWLLCCKICGINAGSGSSSCSSLTGFDSSMFRWIGSGIEFKGWDLTCGGRRILTKAGSDNTRSFLSGVWWTGNAPRGMAPGILSLGGTGPCELTA